MKQRTNKAGLRGHALKRFGAALTLFNLVGRELLGFEESWFSALICILTGILTEIILETIDSKLNKRQNQLLIDPSETFYFLLPAYISCLSLSMLIYAGDLLLPFVFGSVITISSKYIFRTKIAGRNRHFFNPSAFGICVSITILSNTSAAPPYQYLENIGFRGEIILLCFMLFAGSFMNIMFTRRITVVLSWIFGFLCQAVLRSIFLGVDFYSTLLPITGIAFFLFSFYMIPDPGTSPSSSKYQALFGFSTAMVYGILQALDIVYGIFYALIFMGLVRAIIHQIIFLTKTKVEQESKTQMELA